MAFVSNPRVTLDISPKEHNVGVAGQRALIVGCKTAAGTATPGLVLDLPRTNAELNALFGADAELAMTARRFRRVNKATTLDALVFEDAAAAAKAGSAAKFAGAATGYGRLTLSVVSEFDYTCVVDGVPGQTVGDIAAAFADQFAALKTKPFTAATAASVAAGGNAMPDKIAFTAANGGTISNGWLIAVSGHIPGITVTLDGWTGGGGDPSLTAAFDALINIRHQTIVWPSSWATRGLKLFLDARRNVTNDVKEGRAFMYHTGNFADVKADALTLNSSEIVVFSNAPNASATWIGPHLPEAPNTIAAMFAAARARRFEDGVNIADIVANNERGDQTGGIHTASLPYFNTPFTECGLPRHGSGYSDEEQMELLDAGVSVIGANRAGSAVVAGQVVTTWLKDQEDNKDDTWKFLEWRDTHGTVREYLVTNIRKRFAQYRLTTGVATAGHAMVDEKMLRSYLLGLCQQLAEKCLVVKGLDASAFIERNMVISLIPGKRRAEIYIEVPLVSQFAEAVGRVKFTFETK
jgi:phage tail sheath gpL-like